MAKGCKSKKATSATAKLLAMFLAIGLLAVLGTAGLLTHYAKVTGTVSVSQSVKLATYDSSNQKISEVDYSNPITITASVVAGSTLVNGVDTNGNKQIKYFRLTNYADTLSADVKVGLDQNGDNQIDSSLPTEIESIKFVAYNSGSGCTNTEIGSEISGAVGRQLTLGAEQSQDFCIKVVFKINTQPGNYDLRFIVLPAS